MSAAAPAMTTTGARSRRGRRMGPIMPENTAAHRLVAVRGELASGVLLGGELALGLRARSGLVAGLARAARVARRRGGRRRGRRGGRPPPAAPHAPAARRK